MLARLKPVCGVSRGAGRAWNSGLAARSPASRSSAGGGEALLRQVVQQVAPDVDSEQQLVAAVDLGHVVVDTYAVS